MSTEIKWNREQIPFHKLCFLHPLANRCEKSPGNLIPREDAHKIAEKELFYGIPSTSTIIDKLRDPEDEATRQVAEVLRDPYWATFFEDTASQWCKEHYEGPEARPALPT